MDKYIDLHMHSKYSDDGEFTPSELVEMCHRSGIKIMAIADHNSVKAIDEAKEAAKKYDIKYISATEIDCTYNGINLHVLGYGIDYHHEDFKRLEQNVLDQANANLATAQKALTDAQAKQKAAENNLSAEKAKLASLQQVSNEKTQDVKAAQVALDDAKNKLAALENAPLLVKAAEDKLAAAQKALDPVENVLVSEKAKLSALKQDLADAQADVTTAQKNYDEKLAIQTKAQTDLDNAKKVLQAIYDREALEAQIAAQEKAREEAEKKAAEEKAQAEKNGYHVDGNKVVDENGNQVSNWTVKNGQIIDNKGKVVSGLTINKAGAVVNKTGQQINSKNVVDNLQANKRTQAPVVQSKVAGKTYVSTVVVPEKAKANALPQTGEKESKTTLVGAILVGLGSLVGLFGLGRKKEY